jgi:PPOX class probable F420-dependent enzyme
MSDRPTLTPHASPESEPEPELEPVDEPETGPEPGTELETGPEPRTEAGPQTRPEPGSHPGPESGIASSVRRRLDRERVVWLGTVRPDGAPHLMPLWFSWDETAITVYSKPDAQKVRNIRRDPRVMLAIGTPGASMDVTLLEGRAELPVVAPEPTPAHALLTRYHADMRTLGTDLSEFISTYSQPIRIVPTRVLDWGAPGWLPRDA